MRQKAFIVKTLVYLTFVICLVGVILAVSYRIRHPTESDSNTQRYERPAQEPTAVTEQSYSEPNREVREHQQSYAEKSTEPIVILTAFLVLFVAITNWIYYRQLKKMRETVALVAGQNKMMQDSLAETRKIVAQNETAIAVSKKAAKRSAKISKYAERAYVAAKIRRTEKSKLQFLLRIENSGNTPANDVWIHYSYGLLDAPPHKETAGWPVVYDIGFTEHERLGFIAPHSSYHVVSTPQLPLPSGTEAQRWQLGQLRFYCWGKITYEDIFNLQWDSFFCFFQSQERQDGYPCKYGNEAR